MATSADNPPPSSGIAPVEDAAQLNTLSDPSANTSVDAQPLSKNARKKAARAARLAEVKLERRARERERRKDKKRAEREERERKRAIGKDVSDSELPAKKRARKERKEPFGARIVIDLGFDDMMTEKVRICLVLMLYLIDYEA